MAKILHVVHRFIPDSIGGTESYVYQLCKEQIKNGHQTYVFCHLNQEYKKAKYEEKNIEGIHVFSVFVPLSIWLFLNKKRLEKLFKYFLTKIKPDIIHIHHLAAQNIELSSFLFIIDVIKKYKKILPQTKILVSVHDWWYFCSRSQYFRSNFKLCHRSHFLDCLKCDGFRPLKFPYSIFYTFYYPFLWYQKREKIQTLFNLATQIIFGSNTIKSDYFKVFKFKEKKTEVIPYGLAFELPNHISIKNRFKSPLKIGYVGRLAFVKGVHILIQALNTINKTYYQCTICGSNSDKTYVQHCYGLAKGNTSIQFVENFSEEKKKTLIEGFDILVIPSIGHESFCFTLWEAIACHVPVIVPHFGIFKDCLDQKPCGLFFERNNPISLAEKLNDIINGKVTFHFDPKLFIQKNDWPTYYSKLYDNRIL